MQRFLSFLLVFCFIFNATASNENPATKQPVKILAWNVFMLPAWLFRSKQMERAGLIAKTILQENPDIIILQEVFIEDARTKIGKLLEKEYPYQNGEPEGGAFFRFNCGVFILSKIPFHHVAFTRFKDCSGFDCLSGKGAYLLEFEHGGSLFQVMGTHTQSGGVHETARKQYKQIKEKLLDKYYKEGVPQILLGDLNTNHADSANYQQMMQIFECENGVCTGEPVSYDGKNNDIAKKFFGVNYSLIDYILLRKNNSRAAVSNRRIHKFTSDQFGKYKFNDLSDHYAISAQIHLNQ
jgi:endonuclease/exonuclease/phosphatase family metal-dependent hydrolase